MTEDDRQFLVIWAFLRLRGTHPDWRHVLRGAFEFGDAPTGRDWLNAANRAIEDEFWPTNLHLSAPNLASDPLQKYFTIGKTWWDALESDTYHEV